MQTTEQRLIREETISGIRFRIWFSGTMYHVSVIQSCRLSEGLGCARTEDGADRILYGIRKGLELSTRRNLY